MIRIAPALRVLTVLLLALSQAGCIYSFRAGAGFPSYIRTLAVLPFENSTSRFELTQELHEVLSRELPRSLGVRPAAEEFADAVVRGTIVNYAQDTPSYRASDPGAPPEVFIRQVSLSIRVEIIDRVENVVLWDNSGLSGRGDYLESEIEDVGRAEAIRQLVQQIVDGAQSNW